MNWRVSGYPMADGTNKLIRNSIAEFLIFTVPASNQSIEACREVETACPQL